MKLTRSLFAATVLMAVAAPAFAQLNSNATTSNDRLHLVSSGPHSPYGTYTGQLLQTPGQPVIDMWCDDFTHRISSSLNFDVNVTRFDASEDDFNSRTRFGYASLDNYKKAAYLTQFFAGLAKPATQDLHYTIWHLFNGSQPGTTRPGEATWADKLDNGQWASINTQYWFILSDVKMTGSSEFSPRLLGSQEQLTNVVPEPSAILLVSTGLLGIVGLARVRRRGKKQD